MSTQLDLTTASPCRSFDSAQGYITLQDHQVIDVHNNIATLFGERICEEFRNHRFEQEKFKISVSISITDCFVVYTSHALIKVADEDLAQNPLKDLAKQTPDSHYQPKNRDDMHR